MRITHSMWRVWIAIVLGLAPLLTLVASQALAVPVDVVIALDNSASMKKNDPKFLIPQVVSAFATRLAPDARLGIVLFAKETEVVLNLTAADASDFAQRVSKSLKRVDYRGQRIDIPAGIERAMYELRAHERPEAQRLVLFLTDGFVDIGNPARDLERARWLREDLALEAKRLDIRLFGIALTNAADFQLVQSVAQTTGGAYFRVLTAADIPRTFEHIRAQIEAIAREAAQTTGDAKLESTAQHVRMSTLQPEPVVGEPPIPAPDGRESTTGDVRALTVQPAPVGVQNPLPIVQVPESTSNRYWWLLGGIGFILFGFVAVIVVRHARRSALKDIVPAATLCDRSDHSTVEKYSLAKVITRIGRDVQTNDIVIDHDTVSLQHAIIECRNGIFYLRDLRSTYGTFLNGNKVGDTATISEVMLKHRDRLRFDAYEFEFVLDALENVQQTRLVDVASPVAASAAQEAAVLGPIEPIVITPAGGEEEPQTELKTVATMTVTLTVVKGPEQGRVIEFHEPHGFLIGRARDADLQLPPDDLHVSRQHVFLEICPPHCRLRDIGNTNPAHVNGKPFTERELNDGDILEVGYTQLKVSIAAQVAVHTRSCCACGKPIELLPGEPEIDWCPDCAEKDRRAGRPVYSMIAVRCATCGKDLTQQANSDGRAEELHDVAIYACQQCLPQRGDFAGVTIGDYEVGPLLGEGGIGAVYFGYHRSTARIVALKRLKDLIAPLLMKRFHRETQLLQGIIHSNVVRCVDMGTDNTGAPYLVTEYVPGGCLEDEVAAQGGRLAQDFAVTLICAVLDGLEYLHAHSMIHRDIKPQNILLHVPVASTPGPLCTPKIADFGLAMSYARAGGTRVTKAATGLGTLLFMPPEQVRDAGEVREPADLYAVGVTLYYLLTGQYPFDFPTPAEILAFQKQHPDVGRKPHDALQELMQQRSILHPFQIILNEEPVPIRQHHPSLSRQLAAIVDKAVQKEVWARFQSAAEFRNALQQAIR